MRRAVWSCLAVLAGGIVSAQSFGAEPVLQLTTFLADVTPSPGDGPCVGAMRTVDTIEHPLQMRGVVLRSAGNVFVIGAVDFCGVCNSSDRAIRSAMAQAAGTTIDRVALQSLHQHTAPILDEEAARLLYGTDSDLLRRHLEYTDQVSSRAAKSIRESLQRLRPVDRIVASRAKVDRVAANRRVPLPDGTIGVRVSLTREAEIRDAPEGLIDPWVRTLTFFTGDERLTQLHYYATHPQSFYGDARISWDTVGIARDRLEKETGVFQIYFTGCGGDVTLGKYNDGSRAAREELAGRLLEGMRVAATATGDAVVSTVDVAALKPEAIRWDSAPLNFTVRDQGAFHPETLRNQLKPDQPFSMRLTAAMYSGFTNCLKSGYVAQATRLRIGGIDLVQLPGEPFVQFQLFAQQAAAREVFVCVAGYGECGVWYYGPDRIYTDRGGFEQTWSLTGPCEDSVEAALAELLRR